MNSTSAPLSPALSTPWTPHSKDKKSRLGLNLWDGTHKKVSYFLLPVPRKRDHRKACCFYNDKPSQPLCAIRRVCALRWVSGVRLNDFKKKSDWSTERLKSRSPMPQPSLMRSLAGFLAWGIADPQTTLRVADNFLRECQIAPRC